MIIATAAGRLGKDAELRHTQGGMPVCKFTVACDQGYGDNKTTIWVQCVLFKDRAEKLHPYLVKGLAVTVMGEAKPVYWNNKDNGEANGAIEIICDKVVLQSKAERQNEGGMYEGGGGESPPDDLDSEIPFVTPHELKMKKDVL
jgi:single-strand DNA-binding protein